MKSHFIFKKSPKGQKTVHLKLFSHLSLVHIIFGINNIQCCYCIQYNSSQYSVYIQTFPKVAMLQWHKAPKCTTYINKKTVTATFYDMWMFTKIKANSEQWHFKKTRFCWCLSCQDSKANLNTWHSINNIRRFYGFFCLQRRKSS